MLLSFETLNLVWSKEFIAIAWVDDDFAVSQEDAVASLKESMTSQKKQSAGDETQLTEQPQGENKV